MKILPLFLILLFLGQASKVQAGNEDNRNIRLDVAVPFNLGIAFDFQVSSRFTIGPEISYRLLGVQSTLTSEVSRSLQGFGLRTNWYKNGVHSDGLYVASSLRYNKINLRTSRGVGAQTLKSEDGLSLSGIVGYGWFWGSFNMLLGGGAELMLQKPSIDYLESGTNFSSRTTESSRLLIEYTLGWSF